LVVLERAEGRPVYFGDEQQPEALSAVGAADTPFLIISIDDLKAEEQEVEAAVNHFRKNYYGRINTSVAEV